MGQLTYDDNKLPINFGQCRPVLQDHLIAGTHNRELIRRSTAMHMAHNLVLENVVSLVRCAVIHHNRDRWNPVVELIHPIGQCAEGGNNEMGSEVVLLFSEQSN